MADRELFIADLRERREATADKVRQMFRDVAYWNRTHPTEQPLEVDDESGTLALSLEMIGLDIRKLEAEAFSQSVSASHERTT